MIIPFQMGAHLFDSGSSDLENARALRILLDALIALNQAFLLHHAVRNLYQSGVVYGRTEAWCDIPTLYGMKYGDCKSLSAALIAQYRAQGIMAEPVFRFKPRSNGTMYHILVQVKPRGKWTSEYEDPSKKLGMGGNENAWASF